VLNYSYWQSLDLCTMFAFMMKARLKLLICSLRPNSTTLQYRLPFITNTTDILLTAIQDWCNLWFFSESKHLLVWKAPKKSESLFNAISVTKEPIIWAWWHIFCPRKTPVANLAAAISLPTTSLRWGQRTSRRRHQRTVLYVRGHSLCFVQHKRGWYDDAVWRRWPSQRKKITRVTVCINTRRLFSWLSDILLVAYTALLLCMDDKR
jgi:hypothetical protein